MTDQELQLCLAKMLPEKLWMTEQPRFYWRPTLDKEVLDTEWPHVCHLVEQSLDESTKWKYLEYLPGDWAEKVRASWQQRAEALCKVKGITP